MFGSRKIVRIRKDKPSRKDWDNEDSGKFKGRKAQRDKPNHKRWDKDFKQVQHKQ